MLLRGRQARVQVDDVDVSGLRVSFRVEKTIRARPNKVEVKIYNLSDATRRHIEQASRLRAQSLTPGVGYVRPRRLVFVGLDVGYDEGLSRIFYGDVRHILTEVQSPDIVTTVSGGDGEISIHTSRVNRSFAPGTTVEAVLNHLADAMGVGLGNARQMFRGIQLRNQGVFHDGTVVSGSAARELDALCTAAGFEWSIQDNRLQITDIDGPIGESIVELTPETGLIGSPTRDDSPRKIVRGKCFLMPDVAPGRRVHVKSKFVDQVLRIRHANYVGDTHGNDWYIEWEGHPPRPPIARRVLPP